MVNGSGLAHVVLTRVEHEGECERFRGFLTCTPQVGAALVIIQDDGMQLMTSPVVRVLSDGEGRAWVETTNSIYRLVLLTPAAELAGAESTS
jgi:hypothetical protein